MKHTCGDNDHGVKYFQKGKSVKKYIGCSIDCPLYSSGDE